MVVQDNRPLEMYAHSQTNGKNSNVREIHIAVIGANGSGKSALTVKYMTRRYISEYDPHLEDTYCRHETINGQECMLWIMDTVEGPHRDPNRYLPWADIILVVYSITNRFSFDYAERLLRIVAHHDHSMCTRQHTVLLVGNKTDLDRYRQVSKSQGTLLATTYNTELFETNTTEEHVLVKTIFHRAITDVLARTPPPNPPNSPTVLLNSDGLTDGISTVQNEKRKVSRVLRHNDYDDHSPVSRQYGSDPEQTTSRSLSSTNTRSTKDSLVASGSPSPKSSLPRRSKSPSARLHDVVFNRDWPIGRQQSATDQPRGHTGTLSPPKKSSSALKLLQLFK